MKVTTRGYLPSAVISHGKAGVQFLDRPGRREAAAGGTVRNSS